MDVYERLKPKLETLETHHEALCRQLSDPNILANIKAFQEISRKHRELERIVTTHRKFRRLLAEKQEYDAILDSRTQDELLIEMAKSELPEVRRKLDEVLAELQLQLLPSDPLDEKNVVLEIRAGTGGEEAALFASEFLRAYLRFAERKKWRVEIHHLNETGIGGIKEATCLIEGNRVYSMLRYESGTHRVQRVPRTETQGRIHTSAITVAVLPEAEEIDVAIDEKDLKIDRYRSSGAGGQHVNTTDSAVRITHIPTGIVVTCQDEKSQIKNREKALKVLRSHLLDLKTRTQFEERAAERKSQVGSGDRSEKIRTYNFPQGRVTDHRVKLTIHSLATFMDGDMDDMIRACQSFFQAQKLQTNLDPV